MPKHNQVSHRWRGGVRKGKRAVAGEILKNIQEEIHDLRVLLESEKNGS